MRSKHSFSKSQIFQALDFLSVKHGQRVSKKGWVITHCPFHNNHKFGNSFVHIETGVFNCYSCHTTSNIVKMLAQFRNMTYDEAKEYMGLDYEDYLNDLVRPPKEEVTVKEEQTKEVKTFSPIKKLVSFNPDDWMYCRERGISKEWVNRFKVKLHIGGKLNDYMIIPILDEERKIYEFEARKIKEYEYLVAYYGYDTYDVLKEKWSAEKKDKEYDLTFSDYKWHVINGGEYEYDYRLIYLMRPKTYYDSVSIRETIFRRESLNLDEDMYVEEGLAADSKNRKLFGDNLTCTFGSKLSETQINDLKKFKKKIIIIPDNDKASYEMIEKLNDIMDNIFVLDKTTDDKEEGYESDCQNASVIEAVRYLYRQKEKLNIC